MTQQQRIVTVVLTVACVLSETSSSLAKRRTVHNYGAGNLTCSAMLTYRDGVSGDDDSRYIAAQSWAHGYVTAAAVAIASHERLWDVVFDHITPEITEARRAYCRSTPRDQLCKSSTFTTPFDYRTGPALKVTNVGDINAWMDKFCSAHLRDTLKNVADRFVSQHRASQQE